jgi:hypothetical protein
VRGAVGFGIPITRHALEPPRGSSAWQPPGNSGELVTKSASRPTLTRRRYLHRTFGSRGESWGARADWSHASAGIRGVGDSDGQAVRKTGCCGFYAFGLQVLGQGRRRCVVLYQRYVLPQDWSSSCAATGARSCSSTWKIIPHANSRLPQFGEYSLGPAVWRLKQNEKGETDRTVLLISPHE